MTLVLSLSQSNHRRLSQREFTALPNAVGSEPGQSDQKTKQNLFSRQKQKAKQSSLFYLSLSCVISMTVFCRTVREKDLRDHQKGATTFQHKSNFPRVFFLFFFVFSSGRPATFCLFVFSQSFLYNPHHPIMYPSSHTESIKRKKREKVFG